MPELIKMAWLFGLSSHVDPWFHDCRPFKIVSDDIAILIGETVTLERFDGLEASAIRKRKIAQIAISRQRHILIEQLIGCLYMKPGGVIEEVNAAAGDADIRPYIVIDPATDLALGYKKPEPYGLMFPPLISFRHVKVIIVGRKEVLVSFAIFDGGVIQPEFRDTGG